MVWHPPSASRGAPHQFQGTTLPSPPRPDTASRTKSSRSIVPANSSIPIEAGREPEIVAEPARRRTTVKFIVVPGDADIGLPLLECL